MKPEADQAQPPEPDGVREFGAAHDDLARRVAALSALVDELESRRLIEEVLYRYARGVDRCDRELLTSCYWPDARDVHWIYNGSGYGFAEYVCRTLRPITSTTHSVTNPIIERAGDRAFVESQFSVIHHIPLANGDFVDQQIEGRYLDVFERRGESWRILHRQAVREQSREFLTRPIPRSTSHPTASSGRHPDDPVYLGASIADLDIADTELAESQWDQVRSRYAVD